MIAPRAQMLTTDLPGRIAPSAWPRCARGWPASSRSATSPKVRWSKKAICCSPSSPLPCRRLWSAIAARWPAHRPSQAGRIPVHRYEPLVKVEAVSRREYDDALAALQTARANAVSAQQTCAPRSSTGYATVRAPIGGRIGKSLVSEGSLVGGRDHAHGADTADGPHLCRLHPTRQHSPADARGHSGWQARATATPLRR